MRLFTKRYNRKYKLKRSNKNLINFKKSHPHKKKNKRKEKDVTYFKRGKSNQYRITGSNFNKHHKKKIINSTKRKINMLKVIERISLRKNKMITFFSFFYSNSNNKCVNLSLLIRF